MLNGKYEPVGDSPSITVAGGPYRATSIVPIDDKSITPPRNETSISLRSTRAVPSRSRFRPPLVYRLHDTLWTDVRSASTPVTYIRRIHARAILRTTRYLAYLSRYTRKTFIYYSGDTCVISSSTSREVTVDRAAPAGHSSPPDEHVGAISFVIMCSARHPRAADFY